MKIHYCSFCGKSQDEVAKLIAGPSVFICSECVELCNDIIAEERRVPAKPRFRIRADGYARFIPAKKRWLAAERSRQAA